MENAGIDSGPYGINIENEMTVVLIHMESI